VSEKQKCLQRASEVVHADVRVMPLVHEILEFQTVRPATESTQWP